MKKFVIFVFNGDPMCFIHVLLNALDMHEKGFEIRMIVEGAATKLLPDLSKKEHMLHQLWKKTIEKKLITGVCKACATKMKTLESAKDQGLNILDDMNGHPGMAKYIDDGFQILTF